MNTGKKFLDHLNPIHFHGIPLHLMKYIYNNVNNKLIVIYPIRNCQLVTQPVINIYSNLNLVL